MTAYLVLLAQTRVGLLSGGRGKSFHQLPPQEQAAQREEAYARATVALTRAQELTPRRIPVERKTPAAKREVDQDMVGKEESVSDAESGWSGVSDNSSTDSECTDVEASSVASDQDRFDTA